MDLVCLVLTPLLLVLVSIDRFPWTSKRTGEGNATAYPQQAWPETAIGRGTRGRGALWEARSTVWTRR